MTGNHRIRPDSKTGCSLIRVARDILRPPSSEIQKWNAEVEAKKLEKQRRKEAKRCK